MAAAVVGRDRGSRTEKMLMPRRPSLFGNDIVGKLEAEAKLIQKRGDQENALHVGDTVVADFPGFSRRRGEVGVRERWGTQCQWLEECASGRAGWDLLKSGSGIELN